MNTIKNLAESAMKRITQFIGQVAAIAKLNEIIDAFNYYTKKGDSYPFDPIFLLGPTGAGKTTLASVFAEHTGFQFLELPPNAGWREFAKVAAKMASWNEDGSFSAIPTCLFIDEFGSQKVLRDVLKKITEKEYKCVIERNGVKFPIDPYNIIIMIATDQEIERSQKRRCVNVTMGPVTNKEAQELYSAILRRIAPSKSVHKDALQYLADRTKPFPGDIKQVCMGLKNQTTNAIDLKVAKHVMQVEGLSKGGLDRQDRATLKRVASDARGTSMDVLQSLPEISDVKSSTTRKRLGWLQVLGLVDKNGHGYIATKACVQYLADLALAQKNARAKIAAKSAGKSEAKATATVKR